MKVKHSTYRITLCAHLLGIILLVIMPFAFFYFGTRYALAHAQPISRFYYKLLPAPSNNQSYPVVFAAPGATCGGNILKPKQCTLGYHCGQDYLSNLPFGDVGGICLKNDISTTEYSLNPSVILLNSGWQHFTYIDNLYSFSFPQSWRIHVVKNVYTTLPFVYLTYIDNNTTYQLSFVNNEKRFLQYDAKTVTPIRYGGRKGIEEIFTRMHGTSDSYIFFPAYQSTDPFYGIDFQFPQSDASHDLSIFHQCLKTLQF